jgi:hypothetical protein
MCFCFDRVVVSGVVVVVVSGGVVVVGGGVDLRRRVEIGGVPLGGLVVGD